MTYDTFTDTFLDAMGAWQRGWKEQKGRRLELTDALLRAVGEIDLPLPAKTSHDTCYRKRYIYKENPQNHTGGDYVPIFIGGRYEEGVASWSTDFEWLKSFKDEFRDNANTAIFAHKPQLDEVILNIKALWQIENFADAVSGYKERGGAESEALLNFRDHQSEVILRAPLLVEEIESFCGPIGSYEQLFAEAGITGEHQEDAFVSRLKEVNSFPGDAHWLSREASQRVIRRTIDKFWERAGR